MVTIYALKLQNNKYYIGKTNNPKFRIENHFNSSGSQWTRIYKPLEVIELISDCDEFDEDKITIKYMSKYGIENVRGGSFCQINLDVSSITILNKMINSSKDKCYHCGSTGHFIRECPNKNKSEDEASNESLNGLTFLDTLFTDIGNYIQNKESSIALNCKYCNERIASQYWYTYHLETFCKNSPIKITKEETCCLQ